MTPRRTPYAPKVIAVETAGRLPPHEPEVEAAVVSAILCDSTAFDVVIEILPTDEPFYSPALRGMYAAAIALHAEAQPIDIQTIAHKLRDLDRLQAVGGIAGITKVVDGTPAIANVAAHARLVRDAWRKRRTIEACQQTIGEAFEFREPAQELAERAEQRVYQIARDEASTNAAELLYDGVVQWVRDYEIAAASDGPTGVPTGLVDLDEATSGMHDGQLIIVAGRPGMGKTSLAIAAALGAATNTRGPRLGVFIASLEMPKGEIVKRMVAGDARVPLDAMIKGKLTPAQYDAAVASASALGQLPVWIDDTPAITLLQLRAAVRRRQAEFNKRDESGAWKQRIGLVVVDYLQLMTTTERTSTDEERISFNSRGLKAMAKELGVPVMALAQLNRAVETRSEKNKRPALSDLRGSGAIEQDADVVEFLYRPEYYLKQAGENVPPEAQGYAEVVIAKQRNGPTGIVPVTFSEMCARYENRARDAWRAGGD